MIKFKFTEKDTEYYKDWFHFYPTRDKGTGFRLTFETNGYFDPRPQINTNVNTLLALLLPFLSLWLLPISLVLCFYAWGSLYIKLPLDTKKGNTAESKTYGLMFYHADSGFPNEFWVRGGGMYTFPWGYKFLAREVLMIDGWLREHRGDDFWDKEKWAGKIKTETYPYIYTLKSGEKQNVAAEIYQEKRYWVRWFGLHIKCSHYIEIEFSGEVGERAGSWKGGCTGCSYEIKKGETPLQCLQRMSRDRKF